MADTMDSRRRISRLSKVCTAALVAALGVGQPVSVVYAGPAPTKEQEIMISTVGFNMGIESIEKGDFSGLDIARRAHENMVKLVGPDHQNSKTMFQSLVMAELHVQKARFNELLSKGNPQGEKMTGMWSVELAKKELEDFDELLAAKDPKAARHAEQAFVYVLFAVRDPQAKLAVEAFTKVMKAYNELGMEKEKLDMRAGILPPGLTIPNMLMSNEMQQKYEKSATLASQLKWSEAAAAERALVDFLEKELGSSAEMQHWWRELAFYYTNAGQLAMAGQYLAKAEKRLDEKFGKNSREHREFYGTVALHYIQRGDADKSRIWRQKGFDLAMKAPLKDASVLRTLIEYADAAATWGDLPMARKVLDSIAKRMKVIGKVDANARLRYALAEAEILQKEGNVEEALLVLNRAEALANEIDDRAARFAYHRTVGEAYDLMGRYPDAAFEYAKAAKVGSAIELVTSGTHAKSALRYWAAGRGDAAAEQAELASKKMDDALPKMLLSGTDSEKRRQLLFATKQIDTIVSMSADGMPKNSRMSRVAAETVLRRKAIVLDSVTGVGELIRKKGNEQAREVLGQRAEARAKLAALVYHPDPMKAYSPEEMTSLIDQPRAYDRGLAQLASGLGEPDPLPSIADVQAKMPSNSVLVEFIAYDRLDPTKDGRDQTPDPKYAAFVIPKQGDPITVPLGDAKEIDGRVVTLRKSMSTPKGKYEAPARDLHERLMAKVLPHVGGASHLILAPDSNLNLVPFGALMGDNGKFLVQTHTVTYVASGRELVRMDNSESAEVGPVLVGAPNFDSAGGGSTLGDRKRAMRFTPLPGTKQEVEVLSKKIEDSRVLGGDDALETTLKETHRPVVLHVATHGFFLSGPSKAEAGSRGLEFDEGAEAGSPPAKPEPTGPDIAAQGDVMNILLSANPLLRSGLALSGANVRTGTDDGILTALEVSSMDLRGTRLVVLSACETGVGEVANGEGVYGLRRALTVAGSQSQVMSLWKVDDSATRDLMVDFYTRLEKGEGRGESLRAAQLAMVSQQEYRHPYYWAAFIQSGDWEKMSFELGAPATEATAVKSSGRVRSYWKNPPRDPQVYIGGGYNAPIGADTVGDRSVTHRYGFGVDIIMNVAPRWLIGLVYGRSAWEVASSATNLNQSSLHMSRFDLLLGGDVLGMPRTWRVRPSLNAWVSGGLAWTAQQDDQVTTDASGMTTVTAGERDWAWGLSGTFGSDAFLHVRFTERVDLRLGGGVTKTAFWFGDDSKLAGQKGFARAWRWNAGGALGVIF